MLLKKSIEEFDEASIANVAPFKTQELQIDVANHFDSCLKHLNVAMRTLLFCPKDLAGQTVTSIREYEAALYKNKIRAGLATMRASFLQTPHTYTSSTESIRNADCVWAVKKMRLSETAKNTNIKTGHVDYEEIEEIKEIEKTAKEFPFIQDEQSTWEAPVDHINGYGHYVTELLAFGEGRGQEAIYLLQNAWCERVQARKVGGADDTPETLDKQTKEIAKHVQTLRHLLWDRQTRIESYPWLQGLWIAQTLYIWNKRSEENAVARYEAEKVKQQNHADKSAQQALYQAAQPGDTLDAPTLETKPFLLQMVLFATFQQNENGALSNTDRLAFKKGLDDVDNSNNKNVDAMYAAKEFAFVQESWKMRCRDADYTNENKATDAKALAKWLTYIKQGLWTSEQTKTAITDFNDASIRDAKPVTQEDYYTHEQKFLDLRMSLVSQSTTFIWGSKLQTHVDLKMCGRKLSDKMKNYTNFGTRMRQVERIVNTFRTVPNSKIPRYVLNALEKADKNEKRRLLGPLCNGVSLNNEDIVKVIKRATTIDVDEKEIPPVQPVIIELLSKRHADNNKSKILSLLEFKHKRLSLLEVCKKSNTKLQSKKTKALKGRDKRFINHEHNDTLNDYCKHVQQMRAVLCTLTSEEPTELFEYSTVHVGVAIAWLLAGK
jgi:hypothetical protein